MSRTDLAKPALAPCSRTFREVPGVWGADGHGRSPLCSPAGSEGHQPQRARPERGSEGHVGKRQLCLPQRFGICMISGPLSSPKGASKALACLSCLVACRLPTAMPGTSQTYPQTSSYRVNASHSGEGGKGHLGEKWGLHGTQPLC